MTEKVHRDADVSLPQIEWEKLWIEEGEARYAAFLEGRTRAIDGDEVFARARSRKAPNPPAR